jgi:dipeptidyl aminopeptidase/acylaminoacyl peptidase
MNKMLKKWCYGCVASALSLMSFADGLTVEKLITLNTLHDIVVSPTGDTLVYGVKNPSTGANHLYVKSLTNGKVKQLTSHKMGEFNVKFAGDGQTLYFLSNRSGTNQIWQLSLTGGEAQQLSHLPIDIDGFTMTPDAKHFALAITVKPGCVDFQCSLDAIKSFNNRKAKVRQYDQLMVRHWDQWLTPFKQHLFYASLDQSGKLTQAQDLISEWTTDIAGISEVAIAPDASALVFAAKQPANNQAWTTNFDLFEVNLASKAITNITAENKAWDAAPTYSTDGRFLAYKAMKTPGYESDKFSVVVRDNLTQRVRTIAGTWDRSVNEMIFAQDNRTILVTAQDVGQQSIYAINPEFGDVRKIYDQGYNSQLQQAGENLYFVHHSLNTPPDVYQINQDGYGLKALTAINQSELKDITFAEFEQFSFKGWNNETVYGYWLKPVDFEEGQRYPIAFLVHGGPQGSFGNMFHFRWNAQLWAAQGYGVVMIDFHGSTGYGQAFTDSITGDWGGKPLEDLQKGLEYIAQAQPWLDDKRACALGASYGGYMMNWIQSQWPEQFQCIVNHAGLFDMPSFYTSTEELWFPEHDLGGPVWKGSPDYQRFNPAAFVTQWKTPMLVLQGERDYRVPYAQSLGAFTALQRQGIPSRLVMFPDENHHIKNPDNLVVWYHEVFNWLAKYTQVAQQ